MLNLSYLVLIELNQLFFVVNGTSFLIDKYNEHIRDIENEEIDKENCSFVERYENEYVMNCVRPKRFDNEALFHIH